MAGGQSKQSKDEAWEIGKDPQVNIETWMDDKWGLPHGQKLSQLAWDARNNTLLLNRYVAAQADVHRLSGLLKNKQIPKNGALSNKRWETLNNLISGTNIALPDQIDITEGASLLHDRATGVGKVHKKKQQKTYRNILEHVAALMEEVSSIYEAGLMSVDLKRKDADFFALGALEKHAFMKTMQGYASGICHVQMYQNLDQTMRLVTRGD